MSLIVEDGTGKVDAESYVSFADATKYHDDFGNEGWPTDETAGEKLLRRATDFVDGKWGRRFKGVKVTGAQALCWPRKYTFDDDGRYIAGAAMPIALVKLTCQVALLLETDADFDASIQRGVRQTSVKIGPIEESNSYDVNGTVAKRYPILLRYVRTLLDGSGLSVPIERA